jgi:hypothetical protein
MTVALAPPVPVHKSMKLLEKMGLCASINAVPGLITCSR